MATDTSELRGIRGWLLFFVIVLGLIGPVSSALSFSQELSSLAEADPEWGASVDYEDTVMGAWVVWGTTTILALAAVLLLVLRRTPSSVWITIAVLWVIGPAVSGLVLLDSATLGEPVPAELWVGFARSLIPAAIWTAYLMKSDRVANTYSFRRASVADPRTN